MDADRTAVRSPYCVRVGVHLKAVAQMHETVCNQVTGRSGSLFGHSLKAVTQIRCEKEN